MALTKAELRHAMRARLRELGAARAEWSRVICEAIAQHPAYAAAQVVAVFDPLPSEPAIDLLWTMAPRRFVYPRIAGETLELVEVRSVDELHRAEGRTFREPHGESIAPAEVQVILVPGLALTREGERLGRGGGYYDRLLATLPESTMRLGVCFALQVVDQLPCEPYDARVTEVITERA